MPASGSTPRRVALVTLGCARNDVDSEELAGRLTGSGWQLADAETADVVVVNTCGFIDSAKKDSIDTLLAAADSGSRVVAVGCLAERYGAQLAESLPEADAVLGFDHYPEIGERLADIVAGRTVAPHQPRDRRTLLPITPVRRSSPDVRAGVTVPGHGYPPLAPTSDAVPVPDGPGYRPPVLRRRLDASPVAPLKLASGCDRRCAFCAIPSFRGAFVSRPPAEVIDEARWLAGQGVRELVLVSENSTSYGKDLADPRLLETLLPELTALDGVLRVRVSYLQPAELRPTLISVLATTPGVAPYFDLSFQHASAPVLRRMRRFGSRGSFLTLLDQIRALAPEAGIRSNVIVGFPGETEDDVAELEGFLTEARLDAVGVFGYSDEEGTEAVTLPVKVDPDLVDERVGRISRLVEELCAQCAADRIGQPVRVLVESLRDDPDLGPVAEGCGDHQASTVDGATLLTGGAGLAVGELSVGDLVSAVVVDSHGVDLVAEPTELVSGCGA